MPFHTPGGEETTGVEVNIYWPVRAMFVYLSADGLIEESEDSAAASDSLESHFSHAYTPTDRLDTARYFGIGRRSIARSLDF